MWSKPGKRVLVVDDEAMIRRLLTRFLTSGGHRVYEAETSAQALSIFQTHKPFDALLCDLRLGAENGWAVAKMIFDAQPTIAVLMLTGCLDAGVPPDGLRYRVMIKPFTPDELKTALERLW